MTPTAKSGRIFSICDCTIGKDIDKDADEIAECQKKQTCYKPYDKYCEHYRKPYGGHCEKINNK